MNIIMKDIYMYTTLYMQTTFLTTMPVFYKQFIFPILLVVIKESCQHLHLATIEILYNNRRDIKNYIQHNREESFHIQGDFQISSSKHGKFGLFSENFLENRGEMAALDYGVMYTLSLDHNKLPQA